MRWLSICLATGAWLCVGGCAFSPSAPSPGSAATTVILLPDGDGNVGAVSITTPQGTRRIDQAYAFTTVERGPSIPSRSAILGEERVKADFAQLLQAQPPKPVTFMLFFVLDQTTFTEESNAQLPALLQAVLEAARGRAPTEISIFGHADAIGSERRNDTLSAARANAVAKILRDYAPSLNRVVVRSFGYRDPLVTAAQNTPEPRNRRVEIVIH